MTVASYLGVLCIVVLAIFPENDWHWLKAVQTSMQRRSAPSRNKRERLVPADQLMQLGLDLTEAAKQTLDQLGESDVNARRLVAAARDYRDGLTIALLALRPLRVKNLLAIEIGQHLHLRQSGGRHTLHFTALETKNGRSLNAIWPESLQPVLTHYLQKVRPRLIATKVPMDPAHPSRPLGAKLWVAQGGTPLTAGGLYKALGPTHAGVLGTPSTLIYSAIVLHRQWPTRTRTIPATPRSCWDTKTSTRPSATTSMLIAESPCTSITT
jgi:integrase/recombinase XerD